jgi:hypothetical protein
LPFLASGDLCHNEEKLTVVSACLSNSSNDLKMRKHSDMLPRLEQNSMFLSTSTLGYYKYGVNYTEQWVVF